jgi:hypothetical protein
MRRGAQPFKELRRIEREFVVSPGKRLDVELRSGGSIEISGWEKESVCVVVHLGGWNWRDYRIEFDERASGLQVVSYDAGNHKLLYPLAELEIKVPNKFDININSQGGNIYMDGISGAFEGVTRGGSLNLTNLKGRVKLKTMGGDIKLSDSDVSGEVQTMGGQVFIKDVTGGVKGLSNAGHVSYTSSQERVEEETEPGVRISSMGGAVGVETAPMGAELSTMGGDIYVGSAALYVKAKTMSGNIYVNAIDGWVHAVTMFGNIVVNMTGDPEKGNRDVILNSNGGDISLTLPAELSMNVCGPNHQQSQPVQHRERVRPCTGRAGRAVLSRWHSATLHDWVGPSRRRQKQNHCQDDQRKHLLQKRALADGRASGL